MLFLTLKQAESALTGGRLDEAFDLLQPAEVRNHFRGQQLVDQLVQSLVARGQRHLVEEHFAEAMSDAHRAEQLGGNLTLIGDFKVALKQAVEKKQGVERQQGLLLARAREMIDAGELTLGENFLSELSGDGQAEILRQNVSAKRQIVETSLQRAKIAIEREDIPAAAAELTRVKQENVQNADYHAMVKNLVSLADRQIRKAFQDGRIDRASALLSPLLPLTNEGTIHEFQQMVDFCRQASDAIQHGQFSHSLIALRQLRILLPEAKWLETAVEQVETLVKTTESLQAGPLGLMVRESAENIPKSALPVERNTGIEKKSDLHPSADTLEIHNADRRCGKLPRHP